MDYLPADINTGKIFFSVHIFLKISAGCFWRLKRYQWDPLYVLSLDMSQKGDGLYVYLLFQHLTLVQRSLAEANTYWDTLLLPSSLWGGERRTSTTGRSLPVNATEGQTERSTERRTDRMVKWWTTETSDLFLKVLLRVIYVCIKHHVLMVLLMVINVCALSIM